MIKRLSLLFLLFAHLPLLIYGQKFVSDSLVVEFGKNDLQKINATVDTVVDQRNLSPNCIAITERSKYFNIPIDYRILTSKPLYAGIKEMFLNKPNSLAHTNYRLEIKEFSINAEPGFFKNTYKCNSIISVYSVENQKNKFLGTLLYEDQTAVKKDKKQPQKEYEACIDSWKAGFINDMYSIIFLSLADSTIPLKNLIKVQSDFRKNMIISSDVAIGLDSWLVDGEITFSRPEPQPQFSRKGNILRYRHEKKYESLEFSVSNKQYNYRLNDKFLFVLKPKLFWGLNCWNNNEYSKHGLQDIFLLDFSINPSIIYNPFYKRGIICGMGAIADATYIYSEHVKIKPYVVFHLGIKL